MRNVYNFFKAVSQEVSKILDELKDSQFIRTTIQNITNRSNINVILESFILCLIYTINAILNFDDTPLSIIILENFVLIVSYFSAYYFIPKRNFEFKIFVLYLLALLIVSPVIFSIHSIQEIAKTYEFMILSSCVIALLFRTDVEDLKKIPVILVLERDITPDIFLSSYNIVAIVTQNSLLKDQYRTFDSLDAAKKWINLIKIIPIFIFPIRLIYIHNSNISQAIQVFKFANEFGIQVMDETSNLITVDQFYTMPLQQQNSLNYELEKAVSRKKILIEYDGNPILKIFIEELSNYAEVIVSCTNFQYVYFNDSVMVRMAPVDAIIAEGCVVDYVFATACSSPQFFSTNNLNYAITYNATKYLNIANLCYEKKIKGLFLISNNDAITANTWSGASQRLAELYAQSIGDSGKHMPIIPIRLPKTLHDLENSISDTVYCDVEESYNIFVKFVSYIILHLRVSNKVYSIIPENHIDKEQAITLIYEMKKMDKRVTEKVFPSLEELLQGTDTTNVYTTEFVGGHQYDIQELEELKHCRSVIEITEKLLSLLKQKTNPFA